VRRGDLPRSRYGSRSGGAAFRAEIPGDDVEGVDDLAHPLRVVRTEGGGEGGLDAGGVAYPLAVAGVAQAEFSGQANGSLVKQDGRTVGSSLIGQNFDIVKNGKDTGKPDPKWFQPRPSAGGYDPLASGASNLGPNSQELVKTIKERKAAVAAVDGVAVSKVPADAVTASGSGLTRRSPRRTRPSRSAASPGPGAWTRRRCESWSRRPPTPGRSASSARTTSTSSGSTSR
jgi:hypothetical protein